MPAEQRIKAILKSAELSYELGIINATRFGPLIHANVPDYVEIMLKVFIEENHINPTQTDFPGLITAINDFFSNNRPADQAQIQQIGNYFIETRRAFRNPLHHTERVQGYVIERSEALLCLLRFNEFLELLFPTILSVNFDELNYPCYVQFIKLEYDQNLGRNIPRFYQAVISALQRLEQDNEYHCPSDFDSSRLIAIRHLYRLDADSFIRTVLNYRPSIKSLIVDELHRSPISLSSNQLLIRLKKSPNNQDLMVDEVERCLAFMEGELIQPYGTVIGERTRTSSGNQIIRYRFVV
jgi:hypothetical protein